MLLAIDGKTFRDFAHVLVVSTPHVKTFTQTQTFERRSKITMHNTHYNVTCMGVYYTILCKHL